MDAKILDAFNDLTKALDKVAEAVKDKTGAKSDAAKLLQKVDNIDKRVDAITKGLRSLKKDTTQILKNQETLIRLSKEKKNPEVFDTAGDKKSKIKDGVGTVLMIAAGVLAIGLAFKIIGSVDFVSVIALSIALPIIAKSFEMIAAMKLTKADMINNFFVVVTMSASIAVASWIMSTIMPISIPQGITALLIAGTFALMGFSIEKITKGVKAVNLTDLIKVPIVMLVFGFAIAQASHVMQDITPISFQKGFTAIFIGAVFALLGFSIDKITKNLKDVKPIDVVLLPLILVTFSYAMVLSSEVLQGIKPLSPKKAFAAIEIALVLTVMALPLIVLTYAVKNVKIGDVLTAVAVIPLLAGAILLSSFILSKVKEVDKGLLFNIVLQSIALTVMSLALGFTIYALKALKVDVESAFLGGIAIVIIAGAMAGASQLIAMGNYTNAPSIDWALGTGLSILAFSVAVMGVGSLIAESVGLGFIALAAGAVAVLVIAGAIVGTAAILNTGSYGNYPTLDWALGTGLSLVAFGTGMMALGGLILGSFGLGLAALEAGAKGVYMVSEAIVVASYILKNGNYKGGPTKEWAEGIALAIGAFAPVFKLLFDRGIVGLLTKGPSIEDFVGENGIIIGISKAIVAAAEFFANSSTVFKGGPSAEWAAGVGGAIGAFAPVFEAVSKSNSFFGGGIKLDDFVGDNGIILGISKAIVAAAEFFNGKPDTLWQGGPDENWSTRISTALSAFAPVFDYLSNNSGWFKNPAEDLLNGINAIGLGIKNTAETLTGADFSGNIPSGYMEKLSSNIKLYVELAQWLKEKDLDSFTLGNIFRTTSGLARLGEDYGKLAKGVKSLGESLNSIDMEKLNALNMMSGSIVLMSLMDSEQFEKMMDALEEKAGIFVSTINMLQGEAEKSGAANMNVPSGSKGNPNSEVVSVLNQIRDNTAGLSSLASLPGAINNLKTSLTSLIQELKDEAKHRKMGK